MTVTLANAGAIDRSETDFYPTPAEVTEALMLFLRLPEGTTIWEPAAGEGHMARVMEKWGMRVSCSDLYTYTKENFLEVKESRGDWIITNPPFFASEDFIRHALGFKGGGSDAFEEPVLARGNTPQSIQEAYAFICSAFGMEAGLLVWEKS